MANIILQQLGGNKFLAMTGAKNLIGDNSMLMFSISGTKNKSNKIRITLNNSDLYNVEFFNIRGTNVKEISKFHNIFADQLQSLFTQETGLYTYL